MPPNTTPRRPILKALGATAAVSSLATVSTAQDDDEEPEEEDDEEEAPEEDDEEPEEEEPEDVDALPIVLGGRTEYWFGVSPEEIEGDENPTLELEDGQEYELVWVNLDGREHVLVIEDEDGEELERSDETETAGDVVTFSFEASEEMAEYYCEYHPDDMRGSVELNEGFDLTDDEEMDDEEMDDEEMDDEEMDDEEN